MNNKIKVGIVGIGHMGSYHVRIYSELASVLLVGIADISRKKVNDTAKKYNTIPYYDYTQLYNKVDAVSIAVPTTLHYKVAYDFLNAGIHVLLEKPMTTDLEEAKKLVGIAKEKKLIFQVGHVERFNAAVSELKNIVRDPIFIECQRLGPFNKRINDTGVILDLLIHDIDIVLNLVNSEVGQINVATNSIYSEYEDIANVQIIFKNGCVASLTASRVTEEKIRTLAITQPDAYIFLDYGEQDLRIHRQASSEYILTKEAVRYKQESFIERIFVHKDNPLKLELIHFIDSIVHGIPSISSPEDDLNSLSVALQILNNVSTG